MTITGDTAGTMNCIPTLYPRIVVWSIGTVGPYRDWVNPLKHNSSSRKCRLRQ